MSNLDALRAVYERWAVGDFNTPEIFHPDVRTIWADEIPDLSETRGLTGLASATRQWFENFERCSFHAESFHEDGDRVLVLLRAIGRHRGSDVDVEWKTAHLWTMRHGRAVVIQGWGDQQEAIRESGIAVE